MACVQAGCIHGAGVLALLGQPQSVGQKLELSGTYHTVEQGENLSSIARNYHVDARQLAEVNNLKAPYAVATGSKVFIPQEASDNPPKRLAKQSAPQTRVSDDKGRLTWPVRGKVVSEFGARDGNQYNGIKIEAPEGTPIHVAADGKIGHVGSMPGYGNVVLVEHADRLVTVYAHLKDISVREGKRVARGDTIGTVGTSGRVEGPALYFEVRSRSKPRNPRFFLERKE